MGLRGPGASARRIAAEQAGTGGRKRRPPWQKPGLSRVQRVIAFLESLPITKGPLTGKRMKLLPGQRRFVTEIYGNLKPDGRRKRRLGVKSEPKGNGKTGLVAGLCLCHLLGPEAEARGEVYSAAIDRGQAGIIFKEMEAIILARPAFAARVNIQRFKKQIEVLEGEGEGSIYEALSADAKRSQGFSISLFAYDELAQTRDRALLDSLINGLGKRAEGLGLIISTQAPDDEHPLSQIIDDGLTGVDELVYVQLEAATADADPFDEKTWFACNEALGKFLSLEDMRTQALRAQRLPVFEAAFRNYRLNQRIDAGEDQRIVPVSVWKLGTVAVDREALRGRRCWGALDLSGTMDLSSLTLVFPDDEEPEPNFDVLQFFWTPEDALARRKPSERDLFRQWIKAGYITAVPGPIIRYGYIADQLLEVREEFDLQLVAYDRYRIKDLQAELTERGCGDYPLQEFGQGFISMGPALDRFAELALTGRIHHGGNPVLTACVANAMVVTDPAGNRKFDKDRSHQRATVRIDGAVTLAMALCVAKTAGPALQTESVYEALARLADEKKEGGGMSAKTSDIAASTANALRIFGASGALRDFTVLAGAGCISYGAWLLSHPVGFIVGGVLLIAGAVVQELAHGAD